MAEQAERAAPEVLEELIRQAESSGASDVHLQMLGRRAEVALRLDGVMTPASELGDGLAERVFGRIKFLAKLKTYQQSLPQDGRIAAADAGARSDIRVATYPTVTGEKIVLRLFSSFEVRSLGQLGFPETAARELEGFLRRTSGLLLLTGPAGSGKTTTIYACLGHLAGGGRHVITVEDPVERVIPRIMQTEVNAALGLTFAVAARHLLRQDPQVLVIGEIRDEETANIAVRAAFTGHLVIATLHAGSCRGVFDRLFDMCEDRFAAITAAEMVINQRLIRRLCAECRGAGCGACLRTGYHGRVPLVEWLRVDDALRARIRRDGSGAIAPREPIEEAARRLIEGGITGQAECARVLGTGGATAAPPTVSS